MSRTYVFADEAGNDDFNLDKRNATRYFILTAVTLSDCAIGDQLIALRRQMAWDELDLNNCLHATEDRQAVRDRVFDLDRNDHPDSALPQLARISRRP